MVCCLVATLVRTASSHSKRYPADQTRKDQIDQDDQDKQDDKDDQDDQDDQDDNEDQDDQDDQDNQDGGKTLIHKMWIKKSRIRMTKHLLTDADSSTDAIGGWT